MFEIMCVNTSTPNLIKTYKGHIHENMYTNVKIKFKLIWVQTNVSFEFLLDLSLILKN